MLGFLFNIHGNVAVSDGHQFNVSSTRLDCVWWAHPVSRDVVINVKRNLP